MTDTLRHAINTYEVGASDARPWGRWRVIDCGAGFAVKRIEVDPGGRLSLQSHEHRAEHWIVVSGRARVVCGERLLDLGANESVFIPPRAKHRIENPGTEPLVFVEVQWGERLDEADITRYQDDYARS